MPYPEAGMNSILQAWNELPAAEAEAAILPANGSPAWSCALSRGRPYSTPEALFRAADQTWSALPPEDWQDAFDSHPRLGERHAAASARSLQWSAEEQAGLDQESEALRAANQRYEARFGRVFLLRAAGRSRPEVLAALEARMGNSPEEELLEAAEQQREITHLRLERWLAGA